MPVRPLRPLLLPALALVLTACSAGTSTPQRADVGHGGIADVVRVLEARGLPCTAPEGLDVDTTVSEERNACTIDGERVELVHFFTPEQAQAYERTVTGGGGHGAFADTWAARTETRDLAERLAAVVAGTTAS